ncbi:hypothetical protein D1BOALGB6SA_8394 [Olavius sp. associated proteobacterium Delta 1]|nr:hypothetical protein D1BOALGB6SA_8394 [Olavius sp. associated proteobacterium Delta 1]
MIRREHIRLQFFSGYKGNFIEMAIPSTPGNDSLKFVRRIYSESTNNHGQSRTTR